MYLLSSCAHKRFEMNELIAGSPPDCVYDRVSVIDSCSYIQRSYVSQATQRLGGIPVAPCRLQIGTQDPQLTSW